MNDRMKLNENLREALLDLLEMFDEEEFLTDADYRMQEKADALLDEMNDMTVGELGI